MSTLREHIDMLFAAKRDGNRTLFECHAVLTVDAHLKEIAALLDNVCAPAICAARPIGGLWQCDHCGYFDLKRPTQRPDADAADQEATQTSEPDHQDPPQPTPPQTGKE